MNDVPESASTPPPSPASAPAASPGAIRPALPPLPPRNNSALGCAFAVSLAFNLLAGLVLFLGCLGVAALGNRDRSDARLGEQHYSGEVGANDKIAIITLDGIILEGLLTYVHKQIEQAAADSRVKAVVLRINSPGGSITASDDLHRRITELRDGNAKKKHDAKPVLVSMGSMAASGGYYVAMPAKTIFAERTCLTGSIGVYVSLPNATKLGEQIGFSMNTIKQGQIKDSGSPFKNMSAEERQVWQDMVDESYQRFVHIVEQGRPALAQGKLLSPLKIAPIQAGPDFLKNADKRQLYTRYLADGGVWTADKALKHQLIDQIGTLDDAIQAAHDAAGLGENYQVIKYERPETLLDLFHRIARAPSAPAGTVLDPARLEAGFMPRLWYLAPGAEASGFLAAARE